MLTVVVVVAVLVVVVVVLRYLNTEGDLVRLINGKDRIRIPGRGSLFSP